MFQDLFFTIKFTYLKILIKTIVSEMSQKDESATIHEELICDAKESEQEDHPSSKGQKLKNCLRSCCPLLLDSVYDFGKSKVKDVVAKKTINALNKVTDEVNPEVEIQNIIERVEDIRKPVKDHRNYRYLCKTFYTSETSFITEFSHLALQLTKVDNTALDYF